MDQIKSWAKSELNSLLISGLLNDDEISEMM